MLRRAFLRARTSSRASAGGSVSQAYATASSSRLRPAVATAYAPQSGSYDAPPPGPNPNPSPQVVSHSHRSRRPLLILPAPVPSDSPPTALQTSLYPTSALLDSLALISVCLRRSETTPRAIDIFERLLEEHEQGVAPLPDAQVWSEVIEGAGALVGRALDMQKHKWTVRALDLVERWERFHSSGSHEPLTRAAGVGSSAQGEKIYQGWLRGALHARASLDPLTPYLANGSLRLSDLVPAFKASELPVVFDRLAELAEKNGLSHVLEDVRRARGAEETRREDAAVKAVAEVLPMPTRSFRTKLGSEAPAGKDSHQTVRFAISNLRRSLSELDSSDLPINRQHRLEAASLEAARAELEHAADQMVKLGLKDVADSQKLAQDKLQSWMWDWLNALTARLRMCIEETRSSVNELEAQFAARKLDPEGKPMRSSYHSKLKRERDLLLYLSLLPVEKLALIAILETMRLAGSGGITDGMKTLRAIVQIGKAVETEYRISSLHDAMGKDHSNWLRSLQPGASTSAQPLTRRQIDSVWKKLGTQIRAEASAEVDKLEDEHKAKVEQVMQDTATNADYNEWSPLRNVWTPAWTQSVHLSLGGLLLSNLVDVAKVTRKITDESGTEYSEEQPAFTHSYEYVKGKKLGLIVLNPVVVSRIARDSLSVVVHPKHLPMLVPPRPWKAHDDGAYLHHRVSAMRYKESAEQLTYLRAASDADQLDYVFAGLDVLSSTAWSINRAVFDVVLKVWNSGEAIADIPALESKAGYVQPEKPPVDSPDPLARAKYIAELKLLGHKQWKDHAERCKFNYNLELARGYLNDTFYIPHNMDFRGRAYPIPPHLSPVGDDLCRGLLAFGERKPLGNRGLMWLKIHLANVYGFDKASFKDREKFAEDHMEELLDSADKPLDGKRWWLKAEEPWQCLAACTELAGALRAEDPEAFMSNLPVHQDGTCNGMQHYAALGGDQRGAKAVNLEAGDKPADVYTGIADIVNQIVDKDSAEGKKWAKMVQGKVSRKVVKQTVMTTVYGVTFVGAKDQIAKQLILRGDIPSEAIFNISSYIAKTVLESIGSLFGGARAIQDWLTMSARLISRCIPPDRIEHAMGTTTKRVANTKTLVETPRLGKEMMTSVVWTTPLGLPVVQPYRKPIRKQVMTALQSVYISDPHATAEIAPAKQASAFPPNFIHSLDATHMLLTAMKCRQNGITFASVHDSYWSHAGSIDAMSGHIRQTFIELHSQDIIGDLRREFVERYKDHRIPYAAANAVLKNHYRPNPKDVHVDKGIDAELEADVEADADAGVPDEQLVTATATKRPRSGLRHPETDELIVPEIIAGKKFVRLADILPLTPPKGKFDVNLIKLSPYFFS